MALRRAVIGAMFAKTAGTLVTARIVREASVKHPSAVWCTKEAKMH